MEAVHVSTSAHSHSYWHSHSHSALNLPSPPPMPTTGLIDKMEFRRLVDELGFERVRVRDVDDLFHEMDEDGSGTIE